MLRIEPNFNTLCQTWIDFLKSIYFSDDSVDLRFGVAQPIIHVVKEYPCKLGSVPGDYRKIGNGMLFQKDWPYTKLINHHLYKVRLFNCFYIKQNCDNLRGHGIPWNFSNAFGLQAARYIWLEVFKEIL